MMNNLQIRRPLWRGLQTAIWYEVYYVGDISIFGNNIDTGITSGSACVLVYDESCLSYMALQIHPRVTPGSLHIFMDIGRAFDIHDCHVKETNMQNMPNLSSSVSSFESCLNVIYWMFYNHWWNYKN